MYLHHGVLIQEERYRCDRGSYQDELEFAVPEGEYSVEYVDPETLEVVEHGVWQRTDED